MTAKEGFFRKISGSRKASIEDNSPEKDAAEKKPLSGDLINSVKMAPFQERPSNFKAIASVTPQHKLRRAILKVFDPLHKKTEKVEKNAPVFSPECGNILELYNMECSKEDQGHLGAKPNSGNGFASNIPVISPFSPTLSAISPTDVRIAGEVNSSGDVTDQSSVRTVIEAPPLIADRNSSGNLIDFQEKVELEGITKVSFAATSIISAPVKLKPSSPARYSKDPVRETNILNMQLKVENEIYHEKLEMMNQENDAIQADIEFYIRKLNEKISELSNLNASYDQMNMHFVKLQDAFSDVSSKYNNAQDLIKDLRLNEEEWTKNHVKVRKEIKKYTRMYNDLYDKLIREVNQLNVAVMSNRKAHNTSIIHLETTLKQLQQKEVSLEQELMRKTNKCQELADLCKNASRTME